MYCMKLSKNLFIIVLLISIFYIFGYAEDSNHDHFDMKNLKNICRLAFTAWESKSDEQFDIHILVGGLTNHLYICSCCNMEDPTKVIIRIFGSGTDHFFQRSEEGAVFQALSDVGFGPKLLATFDTGRIEEFLLGRTLHVRDISKPMIYKAAANKFAELHSVTSVPVERKARLMESLYNWWTIARNLKFTDSSKIERFNELDFDELFVQLNWISEQIEQQNATVVFSHNDAQEGNWILQDSNSEIPILHLIDYEYGSYNPRGFDFGNYFAETGWDNQYPEFPGFAVIHDAFPTLDDLLDAIQESSKIYLERFQYINFIGSSPTDEDVNQLFRESLLHYISSHLYWGAWGMLQAYYSKIENFGFFEYAIDRVNEYYYWKEKFVERNLL